tara:strand:+ start:54 stop:422 length:369 start_codon:yes stop_codon:yes gene_type:complete
MALTAANFESALMVHKIVQESAAGATASVDVTGEAGTLRAINISSAASQVNYVKITLTETSVTVGTTPPQIMIKVANAASSRWVIPAGVAFTKLTVWAVQAATDSSTTAPSGGNVTVTFVTT